MIECVIERLAAIEARLDSLEEARNTTQQYQLTPEKDNGFDEWWSASGTANNLEPVWMAQASWSQEEPRQPPRENKKHFEDHSMGEWTNEDVRAQVARGSWWIAEEQKQPIQRTIEDSYGQSAAWRSTEQEAWQPQWSAGGWRREEEDVCGAA